MPPSPRQQTLNTLHMAVRLPLAVLVVLGLTCGAAAQVTSPQRPPFGGAGGGRGPMVGMGPMGMGSGAIGRGFGAMGGGGGGGPGANDFSSMPGRYMMLLLSNHWRIARRVDNTTTGIKSTTTSADPQVASWIRTHVAQMKEVLDSCSKGACTHTPRAWDPLFAAVYRHAAKLDMKVTNLEGPKGGVFVEESGRGPLMKELVQAHAAVVSKFVANGFDEHRRAHAAPAGLL